MATPSQRSPGAPTRARRTRHPALDYAHRGHLPVHHTRPAVHGHVEVPVRPWPPVGTFSWPRTSAVRQIGDVLRLAQAKNLSPTGSASAGTSAGDDGPQLPFSSRGRRSVLAAARRSRCPPRSRRVDLVGRPAPPPTIPARPVPDWDVVHTELRRPGVTQALMCPECRECHPDGIGYTSLTETCHAYMGTPDLPTRHRSADRRGGDHVAAERGISCPPTWRSCWPLTARSTGPG